MAKEMKNWTEADFAADAAARKAALANVSSQMEAELAESMGSHEEQTE